MAERKKLKFSFRTILVVLTAILVAYVVYQNWDDILLAGEELKNTNVLVLLLLIPEQLMMYFACGQIFFSYLKNRKNVKKFSNKDILKISTELNFVNHAVPAGGVGGLAFLTYRLKGYGVTAGQSSFLYIFRYAVTTVINYLQALVAILVLLGLNLVPEEAMWIVPAALLMNAGVAVGLGLIIFIASSNKRINFFAQMVAKLSNSVIKFVTFGRKKQVVKNVAIENYFADIHASVKTVKENKRFLKKPAVWGVIYSLFEVGTYWIVAISLGRPDLLPYIMVGEAIGSVFDGIVPYGLYEVSMAGVMVALLGEGSGGVVISVTVLTRVITLLFTIASGAWPYYRAIEGKKEEIKQNE